MTWQDIGRKVTKGVEGKLVGLLSSYVANKGVGFLSKGFKGGGSAPPGKSKWNKGKATKGRKSKGRKSTKGRRGKKKRSCVTKATVSRMINKKDEMPTAEVQATTCGGTTFNNYGQYALSIDNNSVFFDLGYLRVWDAVSTSFFGKTIAANFFTLAGNSPIDVPLVTKKHYGEFRCLNNSGLQVEVDMYIASPVIMTNTDFFATWNASYSQLNYQGGGSGATYSGQKYFDYLANPAQLPNLKKFYKWTKTTFNMLPGETRKEVVRGFKKKFMPQNYATPTSTVATPVVYSYVPGNVQVGFVVRNVLATTTTAGKIRHLATSIVSGNQFIVEMTTRVTVECPESAPIANRLQTLQVNNWNPYPAADGTGLVSNVYNPQAQTSVGT